MNPTTCLDEVERLHAFFTGWFRGDITAPDRFDAACAAALTPGFHIITPSGSRAPRGPVLDSIRDRRGRDGADFTIEIVHRDTILLSPDTGLIIYEEWQHGRGRLSSAILTPREGAPLGLGWVHLHETWLAS